MCGPAVAFDLIMLDLAYFLVLIGGSAILRSKAAHLGAWLTFGMLSVVVGGVLFGMTYHTQAAAAAVAEQADTIDLLRNC